MKTLFFAFLLFPFLATAQQEDKDLFCRNVYSTPTHEVEGDTLYMYITCSRENSEDFDDFVQKYLLIMQFDETLTKGKYELYTRILYQQGGLCQTWQVIFIKPKQE